MRIFLRNIKNGRDGTENDNVVVMEPKVIFENDDVLVIDKPAGIIVHSDGRTDEPSIAEWVVSKYPSVEGVGELWTSPQGEVIGRPGIVHRLDRTTSGVMILAKTQEAHAFLKEQFQSRTTQKEYLAFVYGHPKDSRGIIEREIVRIRSIPPRWGVARAGESKKHREAITEWEVIKRGVDNKTQDKVSLLSVRPKTGRTHQIRVHLKSLGYSIICDPLYSKGRECLLDFERPALHAHKLSIIIPSGESKIFEAQLPQDFENALERIAE